MASPLQRTLVLLKPDAVCRGYVGEIISRFEKVGLSIVAAKFLKPTKDHLYAHYETIGTMITRHGQAIFDKTVDMMMQGPVLALVLEGVESIELVRKMAWPTEPKSAAPGTIRGDYAHISRDYANTYKKGINNLIHASGNSEEAAKEINLWFQAGELISYETVHAAFVR